MTESSTPILIDVAVPVRVPSSFHYLSDAETIAGLQLGSVIQVPFRNRLMHAFVLGFPQKTEIPVEKMKKMDSVLNAEPMFDESMLKFLRWVAEYYCHPIGEVISAAIPKESWRESKKKSKPRSKDLDLLGLNAEATVPPPLTEEQKFAVARILDPQETRPVLLHGVTGSGKTEVYMSVLSHLSATGKGAIVLVPEIALTPQLLGRFSARFPGQVAVLHSDLTPAEKRVQWERLRSGEARIVVGARSAIFAPIKNLGLIVVDEEHESSFKQEDSLRYNARDVAVVRGAMHGAKVVLGSATPSLESYANADSGKYLLVTLKQRVQNRPLPKTFFVDLRDKDLWMGPRMSFLTRPLISKIEQVLRAGQQAMLYLNRLGFAHFLFCSDCGHTWRCKNCDVALTYYQSPPGLKCHYCGWHGKAPQACDECQGTKIDTMGAGTEQVEKELKAILPEARIVRMDRSQIKTRQDLEMILNTIQRREVDIVIGTQMIAKGHDFPGVSLVGILMADASLNLPDFRSNERTFQIITQVSGRAGRAENPGEVVIQTLNPDHPVLRAASENRSQDFYRDELRARKDFSFPPFHRAAMVRFQHKSLPTVEKFSMECVHFLQKQATKRGLNMLVLGPASAPLARIKNLYRWQCMVKGESVRDLQSLLRGLNEFVAFRKSPVQVALDIDPISAM